MVRLDEPPTLKKQVKHDISVVVDRLVAGPDLLGRLTDSLETALRLTDGLVQINFVDETGARGMCAPSPRSSRAPTSTPSSSPRSSRAPSRSTRRSAPAPSARASARACRSTTRCCSATQSLSIAEGVILPWTSQGKSLYNYYEKLLGGLARDLGFSLDTPWEELPDEARAAVLRGDNLEVKVRGATATAAR